MNDNPTLRPFESYLDEVAKRKHYANFEQLINDNVLDANYKFISNVIKEANRRMLEDAFKAQKEMCAEHAEAEIEEIYTGDTGGIGSLYKEVAIVDKSSILSAPTPLVEP